MRMATVASGSSGNCIYVGSDHTNILIDCGISGKKTVEGLNTNGIDIRDIDALLVTHEHIDHVKGAGVLARKYEIPIYTTAGTMAGMNYNQKLGEIPKDLFHMIKADENFSIKELDIHPFKISHDANEPVAYRVSSGEKAVAVATDMGTYDDYIIDNLKDLSALVLEANHDVNMLLAGAYPYHLKRRILGDKGHLSNEASGRLLSDILHDKLKYILLGHLSKENNYEELAYETVKSEITASDNNYKADDFHIIVAKRDMCSALYAV